MAKAEQTEQQEEKTSQIENCSIDEEILFENILAEVRASDYNDRTKLLIDAVNNEIKDVMQAVNKYNQNGSIKITLKFTCIKANEMNISAEVEGKKPKGQATGTTMYRDLKGRLYMDDPNQMKLLDPQNVHKISR